MRSIRRIIAMAITVLAVSPVAMAETVLAPPGQNVPAATRPVAGSVVRQAKQHAEGNFAPVARTTIGGQIQEAWTKAGGTAGFITMQYCATCTYKVVTREHMVTMIEVPDGEIIVQADNGDTSAFQIENRGSSRIAVKPIGYGVDSNLILYGKSGAVYPVYVRAESFNSRNITDFVVKIDGTIPTVGIGPDLVYSPDRDLPTMGPVPTIAVTPAPNDFISAAVFDPDKLHGWGDYTIWGEGENSEALKPETVYRDEYFTYIKFGDKWPQTELPTAYVVIDGIDELVNTRLSGRTFIVESIQNLITLKLGESFICIKYEPGA